jgi:hypothetical protein
VWTTCSSDPVPFASSTAVRTAGADSLEPSVANRILVGKMIIAFCLTRPVTLRSYELASSSLLRTPPFPSTSLAHDRSISGILRSPWHSCRSLSQRDPELWTPHSYPRNLRRARGNPHQLLRRSPAPARPQGARRTPSPGRGLW